MRKKAKTKEGVTSFEIFWDNYPRKESKKAAEAKWKSKKLDAKTLVKILVYLDSAVRSDQWSTDRFIPMASTFLNQERWLSDPPTMSAPVGGLAPREPEDPPSQSELESIALATIREAEKRLRNWNEVFDSHTHSYKCQHGFVCAYVAEKRPKVPTLSQARAAYRRMNGPC